MKKARVLILVIAAVLICSFGAKAKSYPSDIMSGTIGDYPITMKIVLHSGTEVNGWYYYDKKGSKHKIKLNGYQPKESDEVHLVEKVNGKITGYFDGKYISRQYDDYRVCYFEGTWTSTDGNVLEFYVSNLE